VHGVGLDARRVAQTDDRSHAGSNHEMHGDPELEAWIEKCVPPERRMRRGLLLENRRGKDRTRRWTPTSLHRRWEAACRAVGLTLPISLYEGTKHTFATNAKRRGVEDRLLQRFLGHRDRRSVERYARLADEALVAVLRPLRPTPKGDGLPPACRQRGERSRKSSKP
jgi:integrase